MTKMWGEKIIQPTNHTLLIFPKSSMPSCSSLCDLCPLVLPSWGLLMVEPHPTPTQVLTARRTHQETTGSPSWPRSLSVLHHPLNIEQRPREQMSLRVNTYVVCTCPQRKHEHVHTHTHNRQILCPLKTGLPVLFLFFHSPTLLSHWPGSCGRDTLDKVSLY